VTENEFDLANSLLDVKSSKVEAAVVGCEENKHPTEVLTNAEFAKDGGGHWLLDCFKLAPFKVAHGQAKVKKGVDPSFQSCPRLNVNSILTFGE
jgi:hypothetical protein